MAGKLKKEILVEKAASIILQCQPKHFEFVTVNWIAQKLGVSAPNLSRAFRQVRKYSVHEFLKMHKLRRAVELLEKKPKATINEIASLLHYSSGSYLTRIFRKSAGASPMGYREAVQKGRKMKADSRRKKETGHR